jgi:glyoxylase-like metal-dependent hydrolase (beta-lactamase superfamily II)
VSRIEEFVDPGVPVGFLLPDLPAGVVEAHRHWLAPRFLCPDADAVDITMQSWLLRTRHHTILVDTCGGNHKPREHFPVFHQRKSHAYLDNLRAAGVAPEDIDFVFCTHLHIDHVGWNTRLDNGRWVPTFRVRAILWSQVEYDHARGESDAESAIFNDSVLPVVEAGLADMVGPAFALTEQIAIEAAPGHTPGHSLLRAKSRGATGLLPVMRCTIRCRSSRPKPIPSPAPMQPRRAPRGGAFWPIAPITAICWCPAILPRRMWGASCAMAMPSVFGPGHELIRPFPLEKPKPKSGEDLCRLSRG